MHRLLIGCCLFFWSITGLSYQVSIYNWTSGPVDVRVKRVAEVSKMWLKDIPSIWQAPAMESGNTGEAWEEGKPYIYHSGAYCIRGVIVQGNVKEFEITQNEGLKNCAPVEVHIFQKVNIPVAKGIEVSEKTVIVGADLSNICPVGSRLDQEYIDADREQILVESYFVELR